MNMPTTLFLLLCPLAFLGVVHTEEYGDEHVQVYLQEITRRVKSSLRSYGISNLPDVDSRVTYNESNFAGYRLVGDLFLEDGYVSDLDWIYVNQSTVMSNWLGAVTLFADMEFKGLTVSRDFRFVPFEPIGVNDTMIGTVTIQPEHYIFNIMFAKNITTSKLMADVRSFRFVPGYNMLTFDPLTGLTQRLKKAYRSQFLGRNQTDVFHGLFDLWKPIFQKFLQDAMETLPFPIMRFRGRKHLLIL